MLQIQERNLSAWQRMQRRIITTYANVPLGNAHLLFLSISCHLSACAGFMYVSRITFLTYLNSWGDKWKMRRNRSQKVFFFPWTEHMCTITSGDCYLVILNVYIDMICFCCSPVISCHAWLCAVYRLIWSMSTAVTLFILLSKNDLPSLCLSVAVMVF